MIFNDFKNKVTILVYKFKIKNTLIWKLSKIITEYFPDSKRRKVLLYYWTLKNDPICSYSILESGLKNNAMSEFSEHRKIIIERISKAYEKAKKDQKKMPSLYQVQGIWEGILKQSFNDLIEKLNKRDYEAADKILCNFHRDKISLGLCSYNDYKYLNTKFYKIDFINKTITKYRSWEKSAKNKKNLEALPLIGNPFGCIIEDKLTNPNSIRYNYYADRIDSLIDGTENGTTVEIGGGFGGLGYLLSKRGLKYIDFDIPEICMIASYYLLNAFPEKNIKLYGEYNISNLKEGGNGNTFDILIMPNFDIQNLSDYSVEVIFNSYSLTEMTEPTIREYYKQIERICKKYFLHVNNEDESDSRTLDGEAIPHYSLANIEISRVIFKNIYRFPELFDVSYDLIPSERKINYEYLYERR